MKNANDVIAALPKAERKRIEARAAVLIEEARTMAEIRKLMDMTQEEVAATLGKPQNAISKTEHSTDMLLSSLKSYVGALGGQVALVARFPDLDPVEIVLEARKPKAKARQRA